MDFYDPDLPERPDPQAVIGSAIQYARNSGNRYRRRHGWFSHWPGFYTLSFDGVSRGNPGVAGAGVSIRISEDGTEVYHLCMPLEYGCTNNEAEYTALIMGLQACLKLGIVQPSIEGDSQLVVKQLNGWWQVKSRRLEEYWHTARELLHEVYQGEGYELHHIPRAVNSRADELANEGAEGHFLRWE